MAANMMNDSRNSSSTEKDEGGDNNGGVTTPTLEVVKSSADKELRVSAHPGHERSDDDDAGYPIRSGAYGYGDAEDAPACSEAPPDEPSMLDRVLSRTSTRCRPGPPPDGGWQAWIVCLSVHLIMMDTWGIVISFGMFQTYYVSALERSQSDIAWIGSLQILLLFFVGTITGRLTDAGYFRALLTFGTVLQTVGIFTAAQGTQYWHLLLSQGLVMGIGDGCLFCPGLAVLSTYFSKRRALALGLATCGSATGGMIFPAVVRQLLPRVGFSWTMRTIGFIQVATLLVANAGLKPRLPPRRTGQWVEWGAFRDLEYTFYGVASFFSYWALYIVFFYLSSFSRDIIGLPYTQSLNLLLVVNGSSVFGRTLPNYAADWLGPINLYIASALCTGIGAFCWIAVDNIAGLYIWTAYYGIAAGGIQSLFPAGLASLSTDLSKAGVRMGMVFTIVSIASFTGPPICGAIITAEGGGYLGTQLFMGVSLMLCVLCLIISRTVLVAKQGSGWKARV